MKRVCSAVVALLIVVGIQPSTATAQADQTIELSDVLYFDCSISEDGRQDDPTPLKLVYLGYTERPDDPEVNFFDPAKIIIPANQAPGGFVLSQRVPNGPLFVWTGRRVGAEEIFFHSSIKFEFFEEDANQANVIVESFARDQKDAVSLRSFSGTCEATAGAEAYYKYTGGGE